MIRHLVDLDIVFVIVKYSKYLNSSSNSTVVDTITPLNCCFATQSQALDEEYSLPLPCG